MLSIMLCVYVYLLFFVFCILCAPIAAKQIAPLGTNKGIDWLIDYYYINYLNYLFYFICWL